MIEAIAIFAVVAFALVAFMPRASTGKGRRP